MLRNATSILGTLTTEHLSSFLLGATFRAVLTSQQFPAWRIHGVLNSPEFFQQSYKIETKFHGWRRSIEMSSFSPCTILSKLGERAERWHADFGVDKNQTARVHYYANLPLHDRLDTFWPLFLQRPSMHCDSVTGWGLYCFLIGMTQGGDWLSLPEIARAEKLFNDLTSKSHLTYGTRFAAFRLHSPAGRVLDWAKEIKTEFEDTE